MRKLKSRFDCAGGFCCRRTNPPKDAQNFDLMGDFWHLLDVFVRNLSIYNINIQITPIKSAFFIEYSGNAYEV